MESRSDETTGRLPPNIRARSDGAIATEWRPTECDALCIWCFCGDSQYPQLINNKKTRARPGSERRFAPVLAIVCRPTLRRFAPSLRAPFSFCVVPVVARLRRSTTGYCLSPLTGLQFRLPSSLLRSYAEAGAGARKLSYKLPFNFQFIERFVIDQKHA